MFGMGMMELMVILVIALLVLGPKKLPSLATTLGKAIRSFRKATSDLTSQLDIEDDVRLPFQELKAALRDEPAPYVYTPPPAVIAEPKADPIVQMTDPAEPAPLASLPPGADKPKS